MRRSLLLFVFPLLLSASRPSNTITVTDLSGSAHTNRTVVVTRVFAQGDIPLYAKPVINGQNVSVWQNDVKTHWRDGIGTCSVSGATNEIPIVLTCADHGVHFRRERIAAVRDSEWRRRDTIHSHQFDMFARRDVYRVVVH